jgi:hypothetical protein
MTLRASGTDNPNYQVSVNRWNLLVTQTVSVFDYMTDAEIADVQGFTYALNVTDALYSASQAIQSQGGGVLLLPAGGYLVGKQTFQGTLLDGVTACAYGAQPIITIKNCAKSLRISGYGAVLKIADGLHWGSFDRTTGARYNAGGLPFLDYNYYGYICRALIDVEGNAAVTIEGMELDGNNTKLTLGGYWGDSQWQLEGQGIWAADNASLSLRDLYIHNNPEDGITIVNTTGATEASAPRPVHAKNVRSRYNGRQGMSLTGAKNFSFENCDFSQTGQALNTVSSEYVQSSPGAGIDIEPGSGHVVRDGSFDSCTLIGNYQAGIKAASGNTRRISFNRCKIEGLVIAKPQYAFEHCTIIGYCNPALAQTDQYRTTTSGVTLTIAGTGPYTITRSAGDFTADGWVASNICQLSGAGLNSNNKQKNLQITGVTSTVLTVICLGGDRTMTAEGPIASCTIATAYTAADGQVFRKCNFTYDASLTESGTLINSSQSVLNEMVWGTFDRCTFTCGSVALPNFNNNWGSQLDRSYPIFLNCDFFSTNSTATNLYGRWQGRNHIEAPNATVSIGLSNTRGRLESGDTILNGTSSRTASKTYDPPSIASGSSNTTTVTWNGAAVGDQFVAAFSNSLSGLVLTAYVSAANTVTAVFSNPTGGAVDLASGTLTVTRVV